MSVYFVLLHRVPFRDRTKKSVVVDLAFSKASAEALAAPYKGTGHKPEVTTAHGGAWLGVGGLVAAKSALRAKMDELKKQLESACAHDAEIIAKQRENIYLALATISRKAKS